MRGPVIQLIYLSDGTSQLSKKLETTLRPKITCRARMLTLNLYKDSNWLAEGKKIAKLGT